MNETRQNTELAPDRIRDDLLLTLKELDRRRHQAMDLSYQLEQHPGLLLGTGVGVSLVAGAWVGVAVLHHRSRRRRRFQRRVRGLVRAWKHPERLALRPPPPLLPAQLGRRLATAFILALGNRLARRLATRLIPERPATWNPV